MHKASGASPTPFSGKDADRTEPHTRLRTSCRTGNLRRPGAMNLALLAASFGAALASGPALRGLIFRYSVPESAPWRDHCPSCRQPLRLLWGIPLIAATGRCRHCHNRTGPIPGTVELVTAIVLAAVTLNTPAPAELLALSWVTMVGVALAFVDLSVQRLPHPLTAAIFAGALVPLCLDAWVHHTPGRLFTAVGGSIVTALLFFALALGSRGIGMGDVRLALTVGLIAGWHGITGIATAISATILLGGLYATGLLIARRKNSWYAWGPFLLASTLTAALLSN